MQRAGSSEYEEWVIPVVGGMVLERIQKHQPDNVVVPNENDHTEFFVLANVIFDRIFELLSEYAEPVSYSVPEGIENWLKFKTLYAQWQRSRKRISSIAADMTRNAAYFQIAGMGPAALPFIFSSLEDEMKSGEPDHWFAALEAITGVNPVLPQDRGRMRRMAKAWLEWGRRGGYLRAEGVGERVSKSG